VPTPVWGLQWLNANSQRSYPLASWATRRDKTDQITLPNSFLVELYFPVHSGLAVDPDKFFIHSVLISPVGYNLTLGYDDGTPSPPAIAVTNVAKTAHREFRAYALTGFDDFADCGGRLAIGDTAETDRLPPGRYEFAPQATPLEVATIQPMIRGISSMVVVNGRDRSDTFAGDIILSAGDNIRLTVNDLGDQKEIVIAAISGAGLTASCECDDGSGTDTSPPIRFINGRPPLADGNFLIIGDDCASLVPISGGLQFTDLCSKPCCGSRELDAIVRQVDRFANGEATLRAQVTSTQAAVSQMLSVIMTSRLPSQGCNTC
jgi:hypothetical protein